MKGKAVLFIIAVILLIQPVIGADKYNIDGDISDWGVNLANGFDNINNWLPTNDTVDWIVEDNIDPYKDGDTGCWDEQSGSCSCYTTGIHKMGTGSSYTDYTENPLVLTCNACGSYTKFAQPSGGEEYDIEAIYFDDDEYNLYFAIIISSTSGIGDLYLNIQGNEYGIVINDHGNFKRGEIYTNVQWNDDLYEERGDKCYWNGIQRTTIESGEKVQGGSATVAIRDTNIKDNGFTNYVIEIKIPRQLVGSPQMGSGNIGYSFSCGNDIIGRDVTYDYNTIPEFATIAIPAVLILGMLYFFRGS